MKIKIITTIILCCIFTGLTSQIIRVPADQPTIQAGIDAAMDGDTVLVADGNYLENINFMGKAITVASNFIMNGDTNHIKKTLIDGSQPTDPDYGSVVTFNTGEDTTSVLCGFTITRGTGMLDPVYGWRMGGGIMCYYAAAKIINNIISGNEINNPVVTLGGGISTYKETGVDWTVIENNTIRANNSTAVSAAAAGGGVFVSGNARICNNLIVNNHSDCSLGIVYGAGVYHESKTGPSVGSLGIVYGAGVYHESIDEPLDTLYFMNNTVKYNTVKKSNSAFGGGVCTFFSKCFVSGNLISHNTLIGRDITGGGVCLAMTDQIDFFDNTISHNLLQPTNFARGAGLACHQPKGMTRIKGNEFSYNFAPIANVTDGAGGGLSLWDADESSNIVVSANRFLNNTAYFGGGVHERSCYRLYFSNNIFYGNSSSGGGSIFMFHPTTKSGLTSSDTRDFHPRIINNTFFSNSASLTGGGAIFFQGILNAPEIVNCIFWDNTAPTGRDIRNYNNLPVTVSYCDINTNNISGPWTGEANINEDPQFVDGDSLCHLLESSPCRDTGKAYLYTPNYDYDGETRPDPVFGLVDMGADEFYDIPVAPVAEYPGEIGADYFIASWQESLWAEGYYLDVAYDENYDFILPAYDNLDVGVDIFQLIENLDPDSLYYYRVRAYNGSGISPNSNSISVLSVNVDEMQVKDQNVKIRIFPNPFTTSTTIEYELIKPSNIQITISNHMGKQIEVIEKSQPQGLQKVVWSSGNLPNGVYYIRLQAKGQVALGKMVLVR